METINPVDLRTWERESAEIPVRLVLRSEKFKVDDAATTIDISLRGMAVRTALVLVPGEWVGVVAKGEFPHAIPTRVVWVREEEPSHWILAGLEFLHTLDP